MSDCDSNHAECPSRGCLFQAEESVHFLEVSYDTLADSFDSGRALSGGKEALWLDLFRQHLKLERASCVLDVGCGTGRFAIPLALGLECHVIGVDPSSAMLAQGKAKSSHGIVWIQGKAETLPFPDDAFDACIASQVLHHFRDKHQAIGEMHRVLKPGGRIGMRYSSHSQLRGILDYRFFPSALAIDLSRVPASDEVRELLRMAGFAAVEEYVVQQRLFDSADEYLGKLRRRYASVLSLISEEEFREGLRAAEAYFARRDPAAINAEAEVTLLIGTRR